MKSSDEILRDFTSLMKGVMPASASTAPTQKSSEAGSQDDSTTSTSEEAATRRASEEAQTVPPPGEVEQGVDVGTARA